jgi:transcriptional regulator with XRE-family HTH domain
MPLDPATVLSEFIADWSAGRRPDAAQFLERVAPEHRDDLASDLSMWLAVAPPPDFDEPTRAAIRAEPLVSAAIDAVDSDAGLWPVLLPRLRDRAGLSVQELAGRLATTFGLSGQQQRTAAYVERMERGELDARSVSRRLLDAMADLLGVARRDLEEAGRMGLRPATAGLLWRRDEDASHDWVAAEIDAIASAAATPAPGPADELDQLFCGGPDA